jgi:hypothetical protein
VSGYTDTSIPHPRGEDDLNRPSSWDSAHGNGVVSVIWDIDTLRGLFRHKRRTLVRFNKWGGQLDIEVFSSVQRESKFVVNLDLILLHILIIQKTILPTKSLIENI